MTLFDTRTPKLVCIGLGGVSVEYGGGCHGSGYSTRDFIKPEFEGVPVLDKRAAVETDEGYRWVFKGPMVNVDLADGECDALDLNRAYAPMLEAFKGNAYGGLLATHVATTATAKRGSLDEVSTSEYIAGWLEHGARLGHIKNGEVVWDED